MEIVREVPQQTHRGELGGADGEAADRESEVDDAGRDGRAGYRVILKSVAGRRRGIRLIDGMDGTAKKE
jgi:hypothetical protein